MIRDMEEKAMATSKTGLVRCEHAFDAVRNARVALAGTKEDGKGAICAAFNGPLQELRVNARKPVVAKELG